MRQLSTELEVSKRGKEDSSERDALLEAHAAALREKQELAAELLRYSDCDPEVMKTKQKESDVAREAANRWTGTYTCLNYTNTYEYSAACSMHNICDMIIADNVFAIKSWAKRKFNLDEKMLNKQFEIPEDFDYVE